MEYTCVPDGYHEQYVRKFRYGTENQPNFSLAAARDDPTVFAYYMLNIKLRLYQSFILDCITGKLPELTGSDRKKFALCLSRQIGKSTLLKVFALWAAYFNKYPSGTTGETKVYLVSRSDDQAKEMLESIRSMIREGDILMAKITQASPKISSVKWLSQKVCEPNNTEQITFNNAYGKRSFIKSSPPTDNVLGKSADILIIDEGSKLHNPDPDGWFNEAASPTTNATDGFTIISSTPNGNSGFFYDVFDPNDTRPVHHYYRLWFNHTINNDERYRKLIDQEIERLHNEGKFKEVEQEYWAKFTTMSNAFFLTEKIEAAIDTNLSEQYGSTESTSIGVDYGMVNSETVLTISKGLTTLRQIAYMPGDTGATWFDDICALVDTYNAEYIVVDDCLEENTEITCVENGVYVPKKIKDCIEGTIVLSYDFYKEEYVQKKVIKHVNKGVKDAFNIRLKNGTSIIASKEHQWFSSHRRCSSVKIKTTEELNLSIGNYRDKLVSVLNNGLVGNDSCSPALAYLIGMYIAEGHRVEYEKRFYISQLKEKYRIKIIDALETLKQSNNYRYSVHYKTMCILDAPKLHRQLFDRCGLNSYTKRIPSEIFGWSKSLRERVFEGMMDGDGCYQEGYVDSRGYKNARKDTYYTVNKELAKDFMNLVRSLGKPGYIYQRVHSGFNSDKMQYAVSICPNSEFTIPYYNNTSLTSIRDVTHCGNAIMYDIKVEHTENFVLWESGIISHNCPAGWTINNQLIERFGKYPQGKVYMLSFKAEKNKMYYAYRKNLYEGKIKYPKIQELIHQMRCMQEIQNKVNVSIEKSKGEKDDRVDSEVMSKYLYLDNEHKGMVGITVSDWADPYIQDSSTGNRGDLEWQQLTKEWMSVENELKQRSRIR